ncbi:MAG: iron complex outermembrane receptor protein [Bacteroidia bacterium]|jgi:iron complex outermembrane receptor protein
MAFIKKYSPALIITVLLFVFCGTTQAQDLSGVVLDEKGNPLISADVLVEGEQNGTNTDVDGRFTLVVQKLPVTLIISYQGFESKKVLVSTTAQGSAIKVSLAPTDSKLGTTVVKVDRVTEKQKESPLTIQSLGIKSIKDAASASFYETLGNLKGVDVTAASLGFRVVNTRGFNSTSPVRSLQLIDGVDNQSPGLNFALGNFLGANDLDLRKVDIIAGASSAFYGPNAFNGVISMETKDPFDYPGLSVEFKGGERNLSQVAFRWADTLKGNRFAYKFGVFYMQAQDWEADNYEPTVDSEYDETNPGGYDAVNVYGDESFETNNDYTSSFSQFNNPGLGYFYRSGYQETGLVDYKTDNLKLNAAFHYKLRDSSVIIYAFNFGGGSTVYQGDNRYRLDNIKFWQNRLEYRKKDNFFIRVYSTSEDAGDTYDIVSTAFKLNELSKTNSSWNTAYKTNWRILRFNKQVEGLPNYPRFNVDEHGTIDNWANTVLDPYLAQYQDSLSKWHAQNRGYVDAAGGGGSLPRYNEGTRPFDSVFNDVTSRLFTDNGTRFYDKSSLYHIQGEKQTQNKIGDFTFGANGRLYTPNSRGTILNDTGDVVITNVEFGLYGGIKKKLKNDKTIINLTARVDKNQNFDLLFSPAASIIYLPSKKHTYRASFSSAIRNPTLADQYLFYDVGRATLIGNLEGFDSLITLSSFNDYRNDGLSTESIDYFNVDPIRPEKAKTIEVGYKGSLLGNSLFVDLGYYYTLYTDFIGYNIGLDATFDPITSFPIGGVEVFRVAANAKGNVTTQGASIGLNYYFKNLALGGNYSWNVLNKKGTDDPIIPAFNTPEHKFNISFNGRNLKLVKRLGAFFGFGINYKWIDGFVFEGSPQFTGFVPTYDMVDAQINYQWKEKHTTFKLGASNIFGILPLFDAATSNNRRTVFNNANYQVYGGPYVGRLAYFSILIDIEKVKK